MLIGCCGEVRKCVFVEKREEERMRQSYVSVYVCISIVRVCMWASG